MEETTPRPLEMSHSMCPTSREPLLRPLSLSGGRERDGMEIIIGDKCLGMLDAVGELFKKVLSTYSVFLSECMSLSFAPR